jgi:hypothetical protein
MGGVYLVAGRAARVEPEYLPGLLRGWEGKEPGERLLNHLAAALPLDAAERVDRLGGSPACSLRRLAIGHRRSTSASSCR